jgi:hypothetical protein
MLLSKEQQAAVQGADITGKVYAHLKSVGARMKQRF